MTLWRKVTGRLQFLQVANNGYEVDALIDTGAQINVVDVRQLERWKHERMPLHNDRLSGVTDGIQEIRCWARFTIYLSPEWCTTVTAAAVDRLVCPLLLGVPFLESMRADVSLWRRVLETPVARFPLRQKMLQAQAANVTLVDGVELTELTPSERLEMTAEQIREWEMKQQDACEVLRRYPETWDEVFRGYTDRGEHHIVLRHQRPIVNRRRNYTETENQVIAQHVDDMLRQDVIRKSESDYVSWISLSLKKNGKWRVCVDLREVNNVTIADKYPLPTIPELLRAIQGSKYFVALDLKGGYWQIPLAEDSKKYTAFACHRGLFEFNVMPFGLTNAPATFQRVMNNMLGDFRHKGVLVYLDDILIHSEKYAESMELLDTVLARLKEWRLKLNLQKSYFFPPKLNYLGQVITEGEIRPNLDKVRALGHVKVPQTLQEVRSLIGFLTYYSQYIPKYAEHMRPVYDVLAGRPNKRRWNARSAVQWTPECQEGVRRALEGLKTAVLRIPLEGDKFVIETDASGTGVGAVLSVKTPMGPAPVQFLSKTFDKVERRWPVREQEAFAIIYALRKFAPFIRGKEVDVFTDHQSLKWMLEAQRGKIANWACLIHEMKPNIYHRRGSQMVPADFLSRHIEPDGDDIEEDRLCFAVVCANVCAEEGIVWKFPTISEVIEEQKKLPDPSGPGFHKNQGVWMYRGYIYVPPTMVSRVIRASHVEAPLNHPGIRRTKGIIKKLYNWPRLHEDVVRYVGGCLACRRNRPGKEALQGFHRYHKVPGLFETVYLDFWQVSYNHAQYTVFTMVDSLSKWAECVILEDRRAETVARVFVNTWLTRFGTPRYLMSDQDKSFNNELWNLMSKRRGMTKLTSTPYHPQGNALIESLHRTLNISLKFFDQRIMTFDEALHWALYAYRVTPHSITGYSPGFMVYGLDLRPPVENDWRVDGVPCEMERSRFLQTLRMEVQYRLNILATERAEKSNRDRIPDKFVMGEIVLLHLQPLERMRFMASYYKAVPHWTIPFRVVGVCDPPTTATVKCMVSGVTRRVHISDVRHVRPPVDAFQAEDWVDEIERCAPTVFTKATRQQVLARYFDPLEAVLGDLRAKGVVVPLEITGITAPPSRKKRGRERAVAKELTPREEAVLLRKEGILGFERIEELGGTTLGSSGEVRRTPKPPWSSEGNVGDCLPEGDMEEQEGERARPRKIVKTTDPVMGFYGRGISPFDAKELGNNPFVPKK